MSKYEIWFRKTIMVNTDPQRRCYDGCNFSEELRWSEWGFCGAHSERTSAEEAIAVFSKINPSREYKIIAKED